MALAVSIRFLTGRAHLHPWDAHPNEGRVEWPPGPWRLLRALVALAGRGFTTLPSWNEARDPGKKPRPTKANPHPEWPPAGYQALTDEWFREPEDAASGADEITVGQLASLLAALAEAPEIWLPRSTLGHTRQYFPIHEGGTVKSTGSPVFDTFAVLGGNQPVVFEWPQFSYERFREICCPLLALLNRLTYFGRAESWCAAQLHWGRPASIQEGKTHWRCLPWDDANDERRSQWAEASLQLPAGARPRENRDYELHRLLAPIAPLQGDPPSLQAEALRLFGEIDSRLSSLLRAEEAAKLLLRCLLRESGQDMRDKLDRPVGTRWISYAVPRAVFQLPTPKATRRPPRAETVNVVRYALNTATVHRPVLPLLTDALLVGEKLRAALMALHGTPSENFGGKDADSNPLAGHQHAFFLPEDDDEDGFIDHVTVWCPRGFTSQEVGALRSLVRLRQRGGRPDLLVTPTRVDRVECCEDLPLFRASDEFVSRTPYVPPRHAYRGSGQIREVESPAAQLRREVAARFPALAASDVPSRITVASLIETYVLDSGSVERCAHIPQRHSPSLRCVAFVQHRRAKEARDGRSHHGQVGGAWNIIFPQPVRGPIALGYGCHFGLGQFRPVRSSDAG